MLLQARKLDPLLPKPQFLAASLISSPSSSSLAVMLADSSLLLYPSLSSPAVSVPPITTAACFLRLLPNPNPSSARVVFAAASPISSGVLLRAWILAGAAFAPARLSLKHHLRRSALALAVPHGISVRLAGDANVLALHFPAAAQIWILAARLGGEEDELRLTKCAVIECSAPIYSVGISMGFLLLGEVEGVRVFPLRPLIKGKDVETRRPGKKGASAARVVAGSAVDSGKKRVLNGVVVHVSRADASCEPTGAGVRCCSGKGGGAEGAVEGGVDSDRAPCMFADKLRTAKVRQNSGDRCSFFVKMSCSEVQNSESGMEALASVKAVSIHAMSQKKFLILDSAGVIHHLNLHNATMASETTANSSITSRDACISRLDYLMKVQMLAVLPDISTRTQVIWISDGGHSVHLVSVVNSSLTENDKDEGEEKSLQISVIQAIFPSDKVQDIVPLSANEILILGQGNLYAYAIA